MHCTLYLSDINKEEKTVESENLEPLEKIAKIDEQDRMENEHLEHLEKIAKTDMEDTCSDEIRPTSPFQFSEPEEIETNGAGKMIISCLSDSMLQRMNKN